MISVKFCTEVRELLRYTAATVVARRCLPPGANVCVTAPANQISSTIRVFFRISNMGCEPTLMGPLFFPSPLRERRRERREGKGRKGEREGKRNSPPSIPAYAPGTGNTYRRLSILYDVPPKNQ